MNSLIHMRVLRPPISEEREYTALRSGSTASTTHSTAEAVWRWQCGVRRDHNQLNTERDPPTHSRQTLYPPGAPSRAPPVGALPCFRTPRTPPLRTPSELFALGLYTPGRATSNGERFSPICFVASNEANVPVLLVNPEIVAPCPAVLFGKLFT